MTQWFPARTVENCPYRKNVEHDGQAEVARCEWLREMVPVSTNLLRPIDRGVCEACCRSFPPSRNRQNPVTAALLAELAEEIQKSGGVAGCDSDEAANLQSSAVRDIAFDDERCSTETDLATAQFAVQEPLEITVPLPTDQCGRRVQSWAVAITTAPRRQPTLEHCLQSLRNAGWDSLFLFADGLVLPPRDLSGVTTVLRETSVGAWSNYWLTLAELLLRQPNADAYLVVQDDAIFDARPQFRSYLEQLLWPGTEPCLVSLYGSSAYTADRVAGWSALPEPWVWGAVAFIFPRELAMRFIADPTIFEHRFKDPANSAAGIDIVIGRWADQHKIPVWFPTPSLVQHVGHASSIWSVSAATESRHASRFSGDPRR